LGEKEAANYLRSQANARVYNTLHVMVTQAAKTNVKHTGAGGAYNTTIFKQVAKDVGDMWALLRKNALPAWRRPCEHDQTLTLLENLTCPGSSLGAILRGYGDRLRVTSNEARMPVELDVSLKHFNLQVDGLVFEEGRVIARHNTELRGPLASQLELEL
jgi:hypothetical protein